MCSRFARVLALSWSLLFSAMSDLHEEPPPEQCPGQYSRQDLLACPVLLKATGPQAGRCRLCDRYPHDHPEVHAVIADRPSPAPALLVPPPSLDPMKPLSWPPAKWMELLFSVRGLSDARIRELQIIASSERTERPRSRSSIASTMTSSPEYFIPRTLASMIAIAAALPPDAAVPAAAVSDDAVGTIPASAVMGAAVTDILLTAGSTWIDAFLTKTSAAIAAEPIRVIIKVKDILVERDPVHYYFGTIAEAAAAGQKRLRKTREEDVADLFARQVIFPTSLVSAATLDTRALAVRVGLLHILGELCDSEPARAALIHLEVQVREAFDLWYRKEVSSSAGKEKWKEYLSQKPLRVIATKRTANREQLPIPDRTDPKSRPPPLPPGRARDRLASSTTAPRNSDVRYRACSRCATPAPKSLVDRFGGSLSPYCTKCATLPPTDVGKPDIATA